MTKSKNGAAKRASNWNLDDIVSLKDWPKLYREIERGLPVIKKWWRKLSPTMKTGDFTRFVTFDEALAEKVTRAYDRAALWESADQKSAEAKRLKSKTDDLILRISQLSTKISLWLKGRAVPGKRRLDLKNAKRLFAAVPDLTYVFTHAWESGRYALSEAEETLNTEKNVTGINVLEDLREIIETEFRFSLSLPGQKPLAIPTLSELKQYVYSEKAVWREAAYRAMLGKYQEHLDKFFLVYQAIVKNWNLMAKRRGFASAIAVRNHSNHVSDQAVAVLLQVVADNRQVFQEFFRLKAKELGRKKLTRFDLYAPFARPGAGPKKVRSNFPYRAAVSLVLDTFHHFSPRFALQAKKIISDRHLDIYPSPVKQSGAFCATVGPKLTPYVLLNYTNTWRDVSTLAHELGHGVHSLYANHHFPSSQHATLPLAETASTLAEMLLFEKLIARTKSVTEKKLMLADKIADSFASILRQTYFVKFELAAHAAIMKGSTAAELSQLWFDTLAEQFGESVAIDPLFKNEWAAIPHIVRSPFYCYAYSFGELLSFALYARYKKEGKSFVPKIEKILAAGGSENPDKILKEVGIDMSDPAFWQGSFEIIKGWVKELKDLS